MHAVMWPFTWLVQIVEGVTWPSWAGNLLVKQIRPTDGRLLFLPKPLPSVLTLIHYKKVQSISQRSPVTILE
jgi:hypothetical protein